MVVLAAGAFALGGANRGSDAPATTTTSTERSGRLPAGGVQLEQRVRLAYGPLVDQLQVLDRVRGGAPGQVVDQAALQAALDGTQQAATATRAEVLGLSKRPADRGPVLIYAGAAELYGFHAALVRAALDPPDPSTGGQLDLLARRVRLLADRVYDRGRVALVGAETSSDGVEVDLVDEVPDFAFEGLAAAAPLTPTAPAAPGSTGRFEVRATTSDAAWRATVAGFHLPAADEVSRALEAPGATTLGSLVERYVMAEQALRAAPDPVGGRERNDLLRLSLLVGADALRATEGSLLAPAASPADQALQAAGRGLAAVARDLSRLALSAPP